MVVGAFDRNPVDAAADDSPEDLAAEGDRGIAVFDVPGGHFTRMPQQVDDAKAVFARNTIALLGVE